MFRHYILPDPLVLILILLGCIFSCLSSTSSDYVNIFPICFYVFYNNPLHVLVVLVPLVLYFYQECWIIFCFMVCCATIHTCRWWLWKIYCIMSMFLTIMAYYCSSSTSKSSSPMTSFSESSFVSLIISVWCIILGSLIVLQLRIILLWWHCTLLCIIILWCFSKLLHIVVLWLWLKLLRGIILWLLCKSSCYMFNLHSICI